MSALGKKVIDEKEESLPCHVFTVRTVDFKTLYREPYRGCKFVIYRISDYRGTPSWGQSLNDLIEHGWRHSHEILEGPWIFITEFYHEPIIQSQLHSPANPIANPDVSDPLLLLLRLLSFMS